jgi:hypothetical protein
MKDFFDSLDRIAQERIPPESAPISGIVEPPTV